ncbi:hypothetical protein F4782DRAFT_507282 [Xylaria castorea]|nr:hypothetical protein F4782DRAFT_507282 [Xylaria castorea]
MCCGSSDDYYTVTPYRPSGEKPHFSVSRGVSKGHRQPQPRDPLREAREKWQRQAQASAAAQRYGWPTSRAGPGRIDHLQAPGNRDSVIEFHLAEGIVAMPGLDWRAAYDPERPRRQRNYSPSPPLPAQRPPYYGEKIIHQQPSRMPPPSMRALPTRTPPPSMRVPPTRTPPKKYVRAESTRVHQRPAIAREIVIQKQDSPPPEPETARISWLPPPRQSFKRRSNDTNCVSLCSDDGIDFSRNRCVSPLYD